MAQKRPKKVPGLNPSAMPLKPGANKGIADPKTIAWRMDPTYTESTGPVIDCNQRLGTPKRAQTFEEEALDAVLDAMEIDPSLNLDIESWLESPKTRKIDQKVTNSTSTPATVPKPLQNEVPVQLSKKQRQKLRKKIAAELAAKESAEKNHLKPIIAPNLANNIPNQPKSLSELYNLSKIVKPVQLEIKKTMTVAKIPPRSTATINTQMMNSARMECYTTGQKLSENPNLDSNPKTIFYQGKPTTTTSVSNNVGMSNTAVKLTNSAPNYANIVVKQEVPIPDIPNLVPETHVPVKLNKSQRQRLRRKIAEEEAAKRWAGNGPLGAGRNTYIPFLNSVPLRGDTLEVNSLPKVVNNLLSPAVVLPTEMQIVKENGNTGHLPEVEISQGKKRVQTSEPELPSKKICLESPAEIIPTNKIYKDASWIFISDKNGVLMDDMRVAMLRKAIENAQYEQFEKNKHSSECRLPIFKHQPELKNGKLCLATQNPFTLQWITRTVDTMHCLWEGCNGFTMTFECIIHTGILFLPGFYNESPEKLIAFVSKMNTSLEIHNWHFYSHRVKKSSDGYDHIHAIGLPTSSLRLLRSKNFQLNYKLESIRFDVSECISYTEVDIEKMLNEYELMKYGTNRKEAEDKDNDVSYEKSTNDNVAESIDETGTSKEQIDDNDNAMTGNQKTIEYVAETVLSEYKEIGDTNRNKAVDNDGCDQITNESVTDNLLSNYEETKESANRNETENNDNTMGNWQPSEPENNVTEYDEIKEVTDKKEAGDKYNEMGQRNNEPISESVNTSLPIL